MIPNWLMWTVIDLSLVVTSGVLIIACIKVWEKAFDYILMLLNLKKEFIHFVVAKHREKVFKPRIK